MIGYALNISIVMIQLWLIVDHTKTMINNKFTFQGSLIIRMVLFVMLARDHVDNVYEIMIENELDAPGAPHTSDNFPGVNLGTEMKIQQISTR